MNLSDEKRKELLELCEKATPGEWKLCHHLSSPENDASCPCGFRGAIWGGDGERVVCEMGTGPEEDAAPRYERPDELINAALIAASRAALPDALKDLAEAEAALLREKWHSHAMEQDRSTYIGVIESAESELGANACGSHGTDLIPKIRALKAERDSAEVLLERAMNWIRDSVYFYGASFTEQRTELLADYKSRKAGNAGG